MRRVLQTFIKVHGDVALAAQYIAMGQAIVKNRLQRDVINFHQVTGVAGAWKLEVSITALVAKITVWIELPVAFYTVNIEREFEDYLDTPNNKFTDTATRLGIYGFKGPERYNKEIGEQMVYLGGPPTDFYKFPQGISPVFSHWQNFQTSVHAKYTFYLGNRQDVDFIEDENGNVNRQQIALRRVRKRPKKDQGDSTDPSLPDALSEQFQVALFSADVFYLNQLQYLDEEAGENGEFRRPMLVTQYTTNETPPDEPEEYPVSRGKAYPEWRYSFDNGDTWGKLNFVLDGFDKDDFSDEEMIGLIYSGIDLHPMRENEYRTIFAKTEIKLEGEESEFSTKLTDCFIAKGSFSGDFLDVFNEGGMPEVMSLYDALKASPGDYTGDGSEADKEEFCAIEVGSMVAQGRMYNLGEGRAIFVGYCLDAVNNRFDEVIIPPSEPGGEETSGGIDRTALRYATYAFMSDDYGKTFPTRQTWAENGVVSEEIDGYTQLLGINDQADMPVRLNCLALVLARGTIFRVHVETASPFNVVFKLSKDGGDTWEDLEAPLEGLTMLMISEPTLWREDVNVDDPEARGKRGGIAINLYDEEEGGWVLYYTRNSGKTWKKGHTWAEVPAPEPQDAARFRSLVNIYNPLPYGVIDPPEE